VDQDPDKGTGFLFKEYSASALIQALQRAWSLFQNRPRWEQTMSRAMSQNHSWDVSAQHYEQAYASAQSASRGR
jgi:starch synthase